MTFSFPQSVGELAAACSVPFSSARLTAALPAVNPPAVSSDQGQQDTSEFWEKLVTRIAAETGQLYIFQQKYVHVSHIDPATLPCLAAVQAENAAAYILLTEDNIASYLQDPDFQARCTGRFFFVDKEKHREAALAREAEALGQKQEQAPQHWFWGILREYMPIYKDVTLASVLVNLLSLATPLFVMNVYDRVVPNRAMETLWVLVAGVVLAYLVDYMLRVLRAHFVDTAGRNADVRIAGRIMDKVLRVRLDAAPKSTGAFTNLVREFEQVREFFGSTTFLAVIDLPFAVLFFCLIAYIGGPMVLVPLVALPCMLALGYLMQIPFQRVSRQQYQQNTHKNSLLVEIIGGLETVKANQLGATMLHRWENVVDMSARSNAKARRLATIAANATLLASMLLNTVFIVWGVYRIGAQEMRLGGLIACVILLGRVMQPLMQFAGLLSNFQKARVSLKALETFMTLPSEQSHVDSVFPTENTYTLEEVEFSYQAAPLAPQNKTEAPAGEASASPSTSRIALTIPRLQIAAGEKVGIIGPTGSGKSTFSRMLAGLYQPTHGSVRLGNRDIALLDTDTLRSRIGFMSQDNYLFSGSLYENIRMGAPYATPQDVEHAAQLAGLMPLISRHPQGFSLSVGERGMALSGGQRQAVALARVLVRNPGIVILDEPTSNFDGDSEQALLRSLQGWFEGRTLFLSTHRLSMLSLVDRVLVLQHGKIVADGPRDAVLRAISGNGEANHA